ncbi:MAG: hypothetical protein ACI9OJ_000168 [Myxococcota bacterium]|jgi:hypothetical protein
MACEATRYQLAAGGTLTETDLAHIQTCAVCHALRQERSRTPAPDTSDPDTSDPDTLAGSFDALMADVDSERGPLGRLRERPAAERTGLGLLVVGLTIIMSWLLTPRIDLSLYPVIRLALEMSVLSIGAAAALWLALRPMHRADPTFIVVTVALATLALFPFLAGLFPHAHALHPASLAGAGTDLPARAFKCFVFGLVAAVPAVVVTRALQRNQAFGSRRFAGAVVGGMAGILALSVHCPITHPVHLVAGHAPVVLGVIAATIGIAALVARRRAR